VPGPASCSAGQRPGSVVPLNPESGDSRIGSLCDRPSHVAQPSWLTTAEAGKRLGVDPTVVIKWVKVGGLRGRRDEDR